MSDKLKELYEKVSGDAGLKESFTKGLAAISNEDEKKSFIIDFAKEQGFTLTNEDFPKIDDMSELTDDDLDNVVGGYYGQEVTKVCGEGAMVACVLLLGSMGVCDC